MEETTALMRLCDIIEYDGNPVDAYNAVVTGLKEGTITTSLPSWETVGCMQYAIAANSREWYRHMEAHACDPLLVDEALILRHLLLDAALETMVQSTEGVDPYHLLQVLTEKAAVERFYGVPLGRSFDESVQRCVSSSAPPSSEFTTMLLSQMYEGARSGQQNHVLARRVADTVVARFQGMYN